VNDAENSQIEERQTQRRHLLRTVLIVLGVLIAIPLVYQIVLIGQYYVKIKRGELPTGEARVAKEHFSRASNAMNATVKPEDIIAIPPTGNAPELGNPDARVTVVVFLDYECSYSQESATSIRAVMETYKDQVHFFVRDYPITELHPLAREAALAADCILEQGQKAYWRYFDLLFGDQQDMTATSSFRDIAGRAQVNIALFDQCVAKRAYDRKIDDDIDLAKKVNVPGTPTFFVFSGGSTDVKVFPSAMNEKTFSQILRGALENLPK